MRVVHLSYNESSGGAARAAYGLHRALVEEGVDSFMLVVRRQSDDPRVETFPAVSDGASASQIVEEYVIAQRRTELSNTQFSTGGSSAAPAQHPRVLDADVIHLHWIPRLAAPRDIGAILALGKPVVWTLHDEWAYTGGCHFTAGCMRWRTACGDCPQLTTDPNQIVNTTFASKALAYRRGPMTIIAPSRWLAQRARESALLRGRRVECIPYGVDLAVFSPELRQEGRARLRVESDEAVVLFTADAVSERRKGFTEFIHAVGSVRARLPLDGFRWRVVIIGDVGSSATPSGAIVLGRIDDRRILASLMAASDLYVLPSLEDNFPNGILEALACGTPCLGFYTGGVPDLLSEAPSCTMVPVGDTSALADAILSAIVGLQKLRDQRAELRAFAESRFTPQLQAQRYVSIYKSLKISSPQCDAHRQESTVVEPCLNELQARIAALESERDELRAKMSPFRDLLWVSVSLGLRGFRGARNWLVRRRGSND